MSKLRAFTMPKWGIEMVEGTLAEWNISEGDRVAKGQVVAQIETDKIVNEVQSEFDALYVRLVATPGQLLPVGALLGVLASEAVPSAVVDDFVRTFRGGGTRPSEGVNRPEPAVASATVAPHASVTTHGAHLADAVRMSPAAKALAVQLGIDTSKVAGSGRGQRITHQDVMQAARPPRVVGSGSTVSIEAKSLALDEYYASPYAKRLALEHHVDLAVLGGTGPRGRISRADVAKAAGIAVGGFANPYDTVRMSGTRKTIARQLTLAKSSIPHFYLRVEAHLDALLQLRAERKREAGKAPSVNDYFIRAAALALQKVPEVNIQVHGDDIRRFRDADVAFAVDAERGLITPVVRAANAQPLDKLSETVRSLVERARAGKLRTQDIEGGTFTVSNLGMFGIDEFDAIINPPQGAILAIGAAVRRPIERGGGLSIGTTVRLSLSCDHRAIDGAVGARFLAALRSLLEAPQQL